MARPDDTLARGNARNGQNYEPDYNQRPDQGQEPQRRDPRRQPDARQQDPRAQANAPYAGQRGPGPGQGPGQAAGPAPGQGPGLTPQFDAYVPPHVARAMPLDNGASTYRQDGQRQNPVSQQGYAPDPYGRNVPQMQPPQAERHANPTQGRPGATGQAYGAGYPNQVPMQPPLQSGGPLNGQTQRPQAQGYPGQAHAAGNGYAPMQPPPRAAAGPQGAGYDPVPPSMRLREPSLDVPATLRQGPVPARAPAGLAQEGYGDDPYALGSHNAGFDAPFEGDDEDAADDNDETYYDDEPQPSSRRWLYAGIAMIAAIGLGGGLPVAYYKLGFGHAANAARPPIVQADPAPVKTVPVMAAGATDSGGKTILERAGSAPAATPATVPSQEQVSVADAMLPQANDSLAGPRKVPTVVVKPGEKIDAAAAQPPDAGADEPIPGVSLDTMDPASKLAAKPAGLTRSVQGQAQPQAMPQPMAPAQQQEPPAAVPPDPTLADGSPQAPVKLGKSAHKMKVASATPPADGLPETPMAPAGNAPPDPTEGVKATGHKAGAGSGYLIQVRSTKTQADALAYFADLQQRYGDLLGTMQPDIQEADLGAKGKWFRLRIGPPGSGAAAKDLCTKLKASGLDACIVAQY